MTDSVKLEIQDSVLELVINREDAGNALSNEIIATMNELLMEHRDRSDLKCVCIKVSGEKFFENLCREILQLKKRNQIFIFF